MTPAVDEDMEALAASVELEGGRQNDESRCLALYRLWVSQLRRSSGLPPLFHPVVGPYVHVWWHPAAIQQTNTARAGTEEATVDRQHRASINSRRLSWTNSPSLRSWNRQFIRITTAPP